MKYWSVTPLIIEAKTPSLKETRRLSLTVTFRERISGGIPLLETTW
jgi:hypothetical protein